MARTAKVVHCSIIIPCFNAEKYIGHTIRSSLAQGADVVGEVIVVDDRSTDSSAKIVESLSRSGTSIPIRLLSSPKKGAAAARNFGLHASRCEYVQWLDADDLLSPGKIRVGLQIARSNPRTLVVSNWTRFFGDFEDQAFLPPEDWESVPPSSHGLEWLTSGRMTPLHAWLGPRALFLAAGPWRPDLLINQDGEYMSRVLSMAQAVIHDRKSLAYYRSGLAGSTSRPSKEKDPSALQAALCIEQVLKNHDLPFNSQRYLGQLFSGVVATAYPRSPKTYRAALTRLHDYGTEDLVEIHMSQSQKSRNFRKIFGWRFYLTILWILRSFAIRGLVRRP